MVFVAALVGVAACARLAGDHLPYALAALGISLVAAWLMYRAAIASARSYGSLLVTIAERHPQSG
jgi:hypothetical protein